jgi:membrane protein implicated in regulation of membrane protease activity
MLRAALLVIAAALIAAGLLVFALGGGAHGFGALILGLVLLVGILFERWRYRTVPPPDVRWQSTGERFTDPQSGRVVEVLYDPKSGERHYVEADGRPYPPDP